MEDQTPGVPEDTGIVGSYQAVEYGPGQAAADATHDILKSEGLDPLAAGSEPETAEDDDISSDELHAFEQRIDEILATGQLDETLRVIDADGVAQVLPVLDSEPIAHLLEGVEEIGGRANVFVRTADGIAVLSVMEYSPDDAHDADDTPTGETPAVAPAGEGAAPER